MADLIAALNSEIPAGGRELTSAEARLIRATGRRLSRSAYVYRCADDHWTGTLYEGRSGQGLVQRTGVRLIHR